MIYLLDVNALIALADPAHQHHARVQKWFHERAVGDGWATCPLTENAFLRIVGNPSFPSIDATPQTIREFLETLCSWPGHQFWSDSLSLRNMRRFPTLDTSKPLTDHYLLGLAAEHEGCLATLDARIDPASVQGGDRALFVLR